MFDYMSLKWKICYYDGVCELRVVDQCLYGVFEIQCCYFEC